jgi:hypothetical protein
MSELQTPQIHQQLESSRFYSAAYANAALLPPDGSAIVGNQYQTLAGVSEPQSHYVTPAASPVPDYNTGDLEPMPPPR